VDTNGLVLAAKVHSADLPDWDGGRRLVGEGSGRPRLELLWADGAYTGGFREWLWRHVGWRLEVPHHREWAVVALRVRGEATRFSAVTSPLGRRAHLRLAWIVATSEQGLRTSARDGRGYDLRRHEPHHAAQAGAGSVKHLHLPGIPDPCLQNSL
jgi:putative transposase